MAGKESHVPVLGYKTEIPGGKIYTHKWKETSTDTTWKHPSDLHKFPPPMRISETCIDSILAEYPDPNTGEWFLY